jgi:hypothetical protein
VIYPIEILENKPYVGIGGGSKTKTFSFRTVLRKNQTGYSLKKAQFIKSTGQRVNSYDQGLTELQTGDIILFVSGNQPVSKDNPEIHINAFEVTGLMINEKFAHVNLVSISFSEIPVKVWSGSQVYHNKDGSLFSGDDL